MNLEDLRPGASVISSDGHKLGTLSRFVVNKDSLKLTHIVVDTGILRSGEPLWKGGWGLSHDRVLPLATLREAGSDAVRLTIAADQFRDVSRDYIEEHFAPLPDLEPGRPDRGDLRRIATSIPGEPGPVFMYETIARAPDEIDIKKDSPVWRLHPHQKIGEVERLIFDEDTGKVTGFVVRRGFLFTRDVVLPVEHMVEVVDDVVRVDIADDVLDQLPSFQADDERHGG